MGLFRKLYNVIRGRGFTDDEYVNQPSQEDLVKESNLRKAEDLQPIKQEKRITETKELVKKETKQIRVKGKESEIQQAEKAFKKSGSINELQSKLNNETVSSTLFEPTTNINLLRGIYKQLLKDSTINVKDRYGAVDETLVNILIENRQKLQHRFSVEIVITTTGGAGYMNIDGILAEQLNEIYNFIQIGATYTSQELKVAMDNAMTYFEKQYGSIGGSIQSPMEKKSKIQDIQIKITFA